MTSRLYPVFRTAMFTASALSILLTLSGCPTDPIDGSETTLTIQNQFSQFNITNIRMIGPDDSLPSDNILAGAVPNGTGVEIVLTAPDRETNPDGVAWTVLVGGQLQLRVKQNTPNEIRPALNADFNDLDVDNNDALSLAEVQSGFPEFTQFELDTFDLNNSGAIELSETGALLRFATASFTCVHESDQLVWTFDGDSLEDVCADAP